MKYYDTITRYRFTADSGVDADLVSADLAQMVSWMAEAEQEVLASTEFHDLAVKALKGDRPNGSLNSWGRKKLSRYPFSFQKHNMNEMAGLERSEYFGTVHHERWVVSGNEHSPKYNKTRPDTISLQENIS